MMGKAVKWGMAVYEQDWLITTYEQLNVTQSNVTAARESVRQGQPGCAAASRCVNRPADDWLMAMSNAAANVGVTIQCECGLSKGRRQRVPIRRRYDLSIACDPCRLHAAGQPHAPLDAEPARDQRAW